MMHRDRLILLIDWIGGGMPAIVFSCQVPPGSMASAKYMVWLSCSGFMYSCSTLGKVPYGEDWPPGVSVRLHHWNVESYMRDSMSVDTAFPGSTWLMISDGRNRHNNRDRDRSHYPMI